MKKKKLELKNYHVVDAMRYLTDTNTWYLKDSDTLLVPPALAESARKVLESAAMGVMDANSYQIAYENLLNGEQEALVPLLEQVAKNNSIIAKHNISMEGNL